MKENSYEEYYIAIKDEHKDFIVYTSDSYKFSEIDLINLIKICILDKRNKSLGRKLLLIYEDSTEQRKELTENRLKCIGLYNEKEKQTKRRNPKIR